MPYIKNNKLYVEDGEAAGGTVVSGSLSYITGWINRSDWTNVHMGSTTTKNVDSNLTHNLNANLSELIIKVFISTDGTDANSFEMTTDGSYGHDPGFSVGCTTYQVSTNAIKLQTGTGGAGHILSDAGVKTFLNTQDYYYKVKVYKIG